MKTNMMLKQLSHVTFVDVYPLLIDQDGNLDRAYSHDGLHVNMKGYRMITDVIKTIR
jgi:lysophospholipase L1-like esterase